jgi:hypothetical protein
MPDDAPVSPSKKADKRKQTLLVVGTFVLVILAVMALKRRGTSGAGNTAVQPYAGSAPTTDTSGTPVSQTDFTPITDALSTLNDSVNSLSAYVGSLPIGGTPVDTGGGSATAGTGAGAGASAPVSSVPSTSASKPAASNPHNLKVGQFWVPGKGARNDIHHVPHGLTGVTDWLGRSYEWTGSGYRLRQTAPKKAQAVHSHG